MHGTADAGDAGRVARRQRHRPRVRDLPRGDAQCPLPRRSGVGARGHPHVQLVARRCRRRPHRPAPPGHVPRLRRRRRGDRRAHADARTREPGIPHRHHPRPGCAGHAPAVRPDLVGRDRPRHGRPAPRRVPAGQLRRRVGEHRGRHDAAATARRLAGPPVGPAHAQRHGVRWHVRPSPHAHRRDRRVRAPLVRRDARPHGLPRRPRVPGGPVVHGRVPVRPLAVRVRAPERARDPPAAAPPVTASLARDVPGMRRVLVGLQPQRGQRYPDRVLRRAARRARSDSVVDGFLGGNIAQCYAADGRSAPGPT